MALPAGTRLGPYEVTSLLGSGGMAEVYRARDVRLGREVAIKILPERLAGDASALARFRREAETASALNHPHLVTIHDIGEATVDDRPLRFIAMELIRGDTLRSSFALDGRDTLLRHLANIADGLAKAHAAGVVHRDLKPENVMVSEDGFAKVVDFGLAKQHSEPAANVTASGTIVGTMRYMAPEQLRGGDVDARADVFAFGCMLYEAVAGRHPFDARSGPETMAHILHRDPDPLDDPRLDAIARKCLAKERARRYASMSEVAAAIREAGEAMVVRSVPRRRSRRALIGAAIAVVALITAIALLTRGRRADGPASIAVLPLRNETGRAEMQYLSDGIAAEVVRGIGRTPALRVIASASTARFAGAIDPVRAARELDVDFVLAGRLREAAGTLLLDAELVRSDGTMQWGRQYSRELADASAIDLDIARDVARELRVELGSDAQRARNAAAQEHYLRGWQVLRTHTGPGLREAIEHFRRAIAIDPNDARFYASLAEAHGRQAIQGLVPTPDALMLGTAQARKALALDDSLPEAHWALAVAARLSGDAGEAARREARVLQLNPNFAPAWVARAERLVYEGRYDEAEAAHRRARSIDPFSPYVLSSYAIHLMMMRRYDAARDVLLTETTLFPDYVNARMYLGIVYSYLGRHDEALAAFARMNADANPNHAVWKGIALARAGRNAEARAVAAQVDEMAATRYLAAYNRALLRLALGEREAALSLLEQAKRDGEWQIASFLARDPGFDPLRRDPRFLAIAAR